MAGVKGRSGGKRANSGRKVSAYTQLKHRIEAERTDDAEYAFALYVAVMRNETEPTDSRLAAGDWVYKQVCGMPKAKTELSGAVALKGYENVSPDDWDKDTAP